MNKKGFTLVELLGVIVILGLIAVIIYPKVKDIIKENKVKISKKQLDTMNNAAYTWISNNTKILTSNDNKYELRVDTLKKEGYLKDEKIVDPVDNKEVNGCYNITWNETDNDYNYNYISTCTKYSEDILNGADPVLTSGMIPVNIADNGTVTKADIKSKWYDYENKKWANMVLVNETSRDNYKKAAAGSTITLSDILGYFVWVPRYKYQLFNATGEASTNSTRIEIKFESKYTAKSTGTTNGEWLTMPGFTFGDEELNGIWVGKFETTGTADIPTILPNNPSLRDQNISQEFETSKLFNNIDKYGITSDAHMAKNSEWSLTAYLSQSKYGRCTSEDCEDIARNNNTNYLTGYGATHVATDGWISTSSSTNEFGVDSSITNAYNTTKGFLASTTGNISGIYDMSGGNTEHVMALIKNSLGDSGFTTLPDEKYYDVYDTRNYVTDDNKPYLGHDFLETLGWYGDYSGNISDIYSWIGRGGYFKDGSRTGLFGILGCRGTYGGVYTFRTIIAP